MTGQTGHQGHQRQRCMVSARVTPCPGAPRPTTLSRWGDAARSPSNFLQGTSHFLHPYSASRLLAFRHPLTPPPSPSGPFSPSSLSGRALLIPDCTMEAPRLMARPYGRDRARLLPSLTCFPRPWVNGGEGHRARNESGANPGAAFSRILPASLCPFSGGCPMSVLAESSLFIESHKNLYRTCSQ